MRRLEVEESNPYSLSSWKPYAEIPLTQTDSYFDQPLYKGTQERLHFIQNPDWNCTLITKRSRICVYFKDDMQFVFEGKEKPIGNIRDGQSYYSARIYIRDDVGSNVYPPVYRFTQRWN